MARKEGFFVDENFCGHGVGKELHMAPLVRHTTNDDNNIIEENMVFTIEPILMMRPL